MVDGPKMAEDGMTDGPSYSSLGFAGVKRTDDTGRAYMIDPITYLFEKRTIPLFGPISQATAFFIVQELLVLDDQSSEPITLLIDSPGGSGEAGMAIYDTMKSLRSKVHTKVIGSASSMAAILLASGDERSAAPNARIMVHNLAGMFGGKWDDMKVMFKETENMEQNMRNLMAFHTGHTPEDYGKDIERDRYMSAEEAKEYGVIDRVDYGVQNARGPAKDNGFRGYYPGRAIPAVEARKAAASSPQAAVQGTSGWEQKAPAATQGTQLS